MSSRVAGHIRSQRDFEGFSCLGSSDHDFASYQFCGDGVASVTVLRYGHFLATDSDNNRIIVVILRRSEGVVLTGCCATFAYETLRQSDGVACHCDNRHIIQERCQGCILHHCVSGVIHPGGSDLHLRIFQFQCLKLQSEGHGTGGSVLAVAQYIDLAVLRGNRYTRDLCGYQFQNFRVISKANVKSVVSGLAILIADDHRDLDCSTDDCRSIRRHLRGIACIGCSYCHGAGRGKFSLFGSRSNGCGSLCQSLDDTVGNHCHPFIGGCPDDGGIGSSDGFHSCLQDFHFTLFQGQFCLIQGDACYGNVDLSGFNGQINRSRSFQRNLCQQIIIEVSCAHGNGCLLRHSQRIETDLR